MARNIGFVIGINQYDNLRHLKYARQDADAVRNFCQELAFEKIYFFAEDASPIPTESGIDLKSSPTFGTLSRFLRVRFEVAFLEAGDNLWFFFAGHGKRYDGRDYLLPSDADPGNIENTALAIQDIAVRLRRSGAGNVILLLDACRDEGSRGDVGIGLDKQQGVITFYSCSPEQESFEIDELKAGAFTHALLQGLRIQGEGNCATVERLFQHVQYQVPYLVEKYRHNHQTPYLVAEPVSKQHLILLPKQASIADITLLKNDALQAEVTQDLQLARELWIRVLAISPADVVAVGAIERLARTSQSRFPDLEIGDNMIASDSRSVSTTGRSPTGNASIDKLIDEINNELNRPKSYINIPGRIIGSIGIIAGLIWLWALLSRPNTIFTLPSPSPTKSTSISNDSSRELVITATQAFSQGDLRRGQIAVEKLLDQGALVAAEGALNTAPPNQLENPSISFLRGRLAWESIRHKNASYNIEDARRFFLLATKSHPANPTYQNALGFAWYAEGNFTSASDAWEEAGDSNDEQEIVIAQAGRTLVLFQESKEDSTLKRKVISRRDRVLQKYDDESTTKISKDDLTKDWRWSANAIADWEKIMALE
jgi:tetratricopeptide (TPR) repeat protein